MFKMIITFKRKAGISREEFMDYYDNRHIPLARKIMPPIDVHRRNYIINDHPFFAVVGDNRGTDGVEPPFDVISEVIYATQADAEASMRALFESPETSRQIMEDEAHFVEPGSISFYVVETHQTETPW